MDAILVPAHVGRLPGKIASAFSRFTAEQWMAWTIIYSPFVLKDFLPPEHYDMWCIFSYSCSILCRPFIHQTEVVKADELMLQFCQKFQSLFGETCVTPNMQLHCHLCKCIEDFGPVFSFWCFSFECFNGILESFQKSWHTPEIQVMEKFTLMQCLNCTDVSHLSPPELLPCFDAIKSNYTLLDDSSKTFDSYSLLNYEKLFFLYLRMCVQLYCHVIKLFLHSMKNFSQNICKVSLKICILSYMQVK